MRFAKWAVAGTSLALIASLFLPCVREPIAVDSLGRVYYETLLVIESLARRAPMPHAIYLLSIPVVSALASIAMVLFPRLSSRLVGAIGIASFGFIALPNVPVPRAWPGALGWWHFGLTFPRLFGDAHLLCGFYAYAALAGLLALGCLVLAILSFRPAS